MYIPFNDYELLYLYKEGNEKAFNLLFNKYEHLIELVVSDYMPYGDKRVDMVQEGRIILYKCIQTFNESIGVNFYTYFIIALKRKIFRLKKEDYYQEYSRFNEMIDYNNTSYNNHSITKLIIKEANNDYSNDEFALNIFKECILGGMKIKDYCRRNNLNYNSVYYKYKQIIDNIKRSFK